MYLSHASAIRVVFNSLCLYLLSTKIQINRFSQSNQTNFECVFFAVHIERWTYNHTHIHIHTCMCNVFSKYNQTMENEYSFASNNILNCNCRRYKTQSNNSCVTSFLSKMVHTYVLWLSDYKITNHHLCLNDTKIIIDRLMCKFSMREFRTFIEVKVT